MRNCPHPIIETEKSHDMPSASWELRKANGMILSEFLRRENQGLADGVNPAPR